ncbi:outer membrane protein OmpW [Paraferrimonas sedimenticola]|uniref:Outer membrane protein W n=1 Tax=Paraferrimonas sedimenticola TaxID=375674 RepID=A0AA37RW83_9GAMM|nr:outer membrane protein OmpW [Paraferrimonas sedimenticola]GLP96213.1 outer membrane protein OmpW [Paraferrimonas sedimenticola]
MTTRPMVRVLAASVLAASFSGTALAHEAGDFIARVGAVNVSPNASSEDVAGFGEFKINDNTQVGLNFTYLLTDNFGIELLAATPFTHKVSLDGVGEIAETKHLPPTLVAQYYFLDKNSKVRPYIGAGVNFTNFFGAKFTNDLEGALTDLNIKNSWGYAVQAGLDYKINDNWMVNGSIWYANIETDVKFKLGGAPVSIATKVNPTVYMLSVGYKF